MTLYEILNLSLFGVLVDCLFGAPQPLTRAIAAGLYLLMVILAVLGHRV